MDAGRGRAVGVAVQLRRSGSAGMRQRSPATDDPADRERGSGSSFGGSSRRSTAGWAVPRFRQRSFCRQCFCRRSYSIRSERQRWSGWSSIPPVPAGLSALALTMWCGITQRSPRTAIACWRATSPVPRLLSALAQPRVKRLLSTDHFSVDGTLVEGMGVDEELSAEGWRAAEAPCGGRNCEKDFHGQKRSNETGTPRSIRSGGAALSQGAGQGGQALLRHGPCADGEPQRPRRRPPARPRPTATPSGSAAALHMIRTSRRPAEADHARRRQGLRRRRTSSMSCAL